MIYWKLPRLQNPVLRILAMAAGLVVMAALLTLGLAVIAVLALGAALMLAINAFRPRRPAGPAPQAAADRRPATPGVIEGEFRVLRDTAPKA